MNNNTDIFLGSHFDLLSFYEEISWEIGPTYKQIKTKSETKLRQNKGKNETTKMR